MWLRQGPGEGGGGGVGGASEGHGMPQGVLGAFGRLYLCDAARATRGPWGETARPETIDKGHRSLWRNTPGLSGDLARITTNGVDDRQKTLSHCRWQRRPSVDHTFKIRCNGYGLMRAMRRILRRCFCRLF